MPINTFSSGAVITAAAHNQNWALAVLTDTSRTITVTHTYTASQTFTGGFTTAADAGIGSSGNIGGYDRALTVSAGTSGDKVAGLELRGSKTADSTFAEVAAYHQSTLVGQMGWARAAADNSASWFVTVADAGVRTNRMNLGKDGALQLVNSSVNALAVGPNGSTNPAFLVDANTASLATGIKITGKAAASGAAIAVISSASNENLTVDAKGTGTITLGGTSTGAITLTRATTASSTFTSTGVLTASAGILLGTGSQAQGKLYTTAGTGTSIQAKTGSTYDFVLDNPGDSVYIMAVPTGTNNVLFGGSIALSAAAVTQAAGVLSIGNTTQTTVGAAGGASALPATPTGYIKAYIGSTQFVIPYYAQA